jgi:ribonucleoside-diphosphate reductase alpha subunit
MLYVTKRNGQTQNVHFDKITDRIKKLIIFDKEYLDPVLVAQKVVASLYPGITTEELDIESARICVNLSTTHPSYGYLGGHILVSNLHKKTTDSFSSKMIQLSKENNNINLDWLKVVIKYQDELDKMMDYSRDYLYDYFGYKTLEKAYLLKIKDNIIERPQDMFMRVAITLHYNNYEIDLKEIKKTYDFMSQGYYTHATPTLFNSANKSMQLSSCFLLGTNDDLTDITVTWNSCAQISKWAGGIGLHVSNIRGKNSIIKSTGGRSNGLVPFLKVFNDIARWIDQGGKRPGSIAIYLEPHHPDIEDFLELRKNFGEENKRARDLFLALWISDLFMKQVELDSDWYLFSDDECPGLTDAVGDDYEKLYWNYVEQKKYRKVLKARGLWLHIMEAQIETGMPYVAFKDTINKKCNQNNLGTIKSSNLCCEITEFSNHEEYAVCNLASIALKQFVKPYNNSLNQKWVIYSKEGCKFCDYTKKYMSSLQIDYEEKTSIQELKEILKVDKFTWPQIFIINENNNWTLIGGWNDFYKYTKGTFDYDKLYDVAYNATINLNSVIDVNYYPVPQTKLSNMKHRPIGLGIQGLADALVLMKIPYDSDECLEFNSRVMETIYLASMTASNDLAKSRYELMVKLIQYKFDHPEFYDKNFILENSEMNKLYHILKPNKYELNKNTESTTIGAYSSFDGSQFSKGIFQFDLWSVKPFYEEKWNVLKKNVMKYGTRNSLLTSLMPTASTSQILGNNECFEFFTNNIYTRNTQAGDFVMVNKYLVSDLNKVGLWNTELKDKIIGDNGSIQNLDIPNVFKELYKTIWEIKQVWVLKGAAARGPFVDQTQSMNIFMAEPDYQRLGSSHFWAWKNGLKTGMYYLRTKPSSEAIKITVSSSSIKEKIDCETCSA